MFSYYLQGRSYYFASAKDVEIHLLVLNKIIANHNEYDHFYKSKDFENRRYDRWGTTIGAYLNGANIPKFLKERVLPTILKKMKVIDKSYMSVADMNADYHKTSNAFLCAKTLRPADSVIVNYLNYVDFRAFMTLQSVGQANFQKCCKIMFKRVIVTEEACAKVRPYGKLIKQVFEQLLIFDDYVQTAWNKGDFNMGDIVANTSLDISDESDTVKRSPKYNQERYFKIPGIGGKFCFLHIKTGALRFHIYPDNTNKKVYVPYIGPHLSIPSA